MPPVSASARSPSAGAGRDVATDVADVPRRDVACDDVACFDVVIVGGGLVGSSLACALEGSGLLVAQVEATPFPGGDTPPVLDERHLALARASVAALQALGVWELLPTPPAPIRRIHISSRGDFGAVRLAASDYRLEAFGAVVPARALGAALEARVASLTGLEQVRPGRVVALRSGTDAVELDVESPAGARTLKARLLVAADGTRSGLRAQLGIGAHEHDYDQTLFVCTVGLGRPHGDVAFERFTVDGPVALLPLPGNRAACVCTVPRSQAAPVAALDDDGYRELLHQRFGYRLGGFGRVGRRSAHPLALLRADRVIAPRAVLVGNAAQTLHPIGAQGFNLGLRDALTLAEELLGEEPADGDGSSTRDAGAAQRLDRYAARRAADRERTIGFSDGLVRAFSHRALPVRLLRSLGLVALDRMPGLAAGLVEGAMGYRGDVPRLALAEHR